MNFILIQIFAKNALISLKRAILPKIWINIKFTLHDLHLLLPVSIFIKKCCMHGIHAGYIESSWIWIALRNIGLHVEPTELASEWQLICSNDARSQSTDSQFYFVKIECFETFLLLVNLNKKCRAKKTFIEAFVLSVLEIFRRFSSGVTSEYSTLQTYVSRTWIIPLVIAGIALSRLCPKTWLHL